MVLNPQLWAEDGPVFFAQAHERGAAAFFEPYAGYFHTVLRLVAWLAVHFDPGLVPAIFAGAATVLTLYVAARTQSARFPLPASAGYALAVVLVPNAGEVLLTLTNLQWILAGALLLVLISKEAETMGQRVHDLVAVAALGLTGPFSIAFAPLFAWRAMRRRTRFSVQLTIVTAVCAALQAFTIFRATAEAKPTLVAHELMLAIPGVRIGGSLLTGGVIDARIGLAAATFLGVCTLAGLAALMVSHGTGRIERAWLGVALVGVLAMALYRCRNDLGALYYGAGGRYFFLPQLIALWLFVAAAKSDDGRFRWIARALLLAIVVLNLPRLREAPLTDLNWPAFAAQVRKGEAVTVSINPADWKFTLPGHASSPAESPIVVPATGALPARVNVVARGMVAPGNPLIAGLTVGNGPPRTFLIRAIGPSLASFGVAQPLAHPSVTLLRSDGADMGFAPARKRCDSAVAAAMAQCGAFALDPDSDEAVGLAVLPPGTYSVVVSGGSGGVGTVLVEIHEISASTAP